MKLFEIFKKDMTPVVTIPKKEFPMVAYDLFKKAGLATSMNEVWSLVNQRGLFVNDEPVLDYEQIFLPKKKFILRRGQSRVRKVIIN